MRFDMIDWIKVRLHEKSTWAGVVAIALAVALLIIPAVMPAEAAQLASENVKWLIGALFIGGLGGVVWHRNV
jgi:uncharacterized membrane protein